MKKVLLSILVASALSAESFICSTVGIIVNEELNIVTYFNKNSAIELNENSVLFNLESGMSINGDLKVSTKENMVTFIDRKQRASITVVTGDYIMASIRKNNISYTIKDCKVLK